MRFLEWLRHQFEPIKTNRDLMDLVFDIGCDVHTYTFASLRRRQSANRLLRWNIEDRYKHSYRFNGAWLRSMITLQNFINGQRCENADLGLAIRQLPLMQVELRTRYTDFYEGCEDHHREIQQAAFSHSL